MYSSKKVSKNPVVVNREDLTFINICPVFNIEVIIADFIDQFDFPEKLGGMRVLDIGAWTGGISLLLAAMGAKVVALEEVVKYSNTVNYLAYVWY